MCWKECDFNENEMRVIMIEDSHFFIALSEKKLDSSSPFKHDEALDRGGW